jgi:hypothetical protein
MQHQDKNRGCFLVGSVILSDFQLRGKFRYKLNTLRYKKTQRASRHRSDLSHFELDDLGQVIKNVVYSRSCD